MSSDIEAEDEMKNKKKHRADPQGGIALPRPSDDERKIWTSRRLLDAETREPLHEAEDEELANVEFQLTKESNTGYVTEQSFEGGVKGSWKGYFNNRLSEYVPFLTFRTRKHYFGMSYHKETGQLKIWVSEFGKRLDTANIGPGVVHDAITSMAKTLGAFRSYFGMKNGVKYVSMTSLASRNVTVKAWRRRWQEARKKAKILKMQGDPDWLEEEEAYIASNSATPVEKNSLGIPKELPNDSPVLIQPTLIPTLTTPTPLRVISPRDLPPGRRIERDANKRP